MSTANLEEALKIGDVQARISRLTELIEMPAGNDEAIVHQQELALVKLAELYKDQKDASSLAGLVTKYRTFLSSSAKAKTAKLIRSLLDLFNFIPNSLPIQIACTQENIAWAKSESRVFLKQSLEVRVANLQFKQQQFKPASEIIDTLLQELKKLDDKLILTEVHLLESQVAYATENYQKAKTALTSARTSANAIYCPPLLQAQLDLQSGILHAEDKDYKTAYSYFFEALEGFSAASDPRAIPSVTYMLLCKIMLNLSDDVKSLLQMKTTIKYAGREIEAMRAVALAHEKRNLDAFESALREYKHELADDHIIRNHLAALYDTLLEGNLLRIIEPYSRVEISYVASKVKRSQESVETKLSQMILDGVILGVLDQGAGCLVLFDKKGDDKMYSAALETITSVSQVVESLYKKAIVL